jgi:FkbM family methyltransferase
MSARLSNRIRQGIGRRRYAPDVEVQRPSNLLRLGSDYGGWTFVDSPDLHDSVILSCGLGEDASFDVEFASRYRAKVILVDPTPRAIRHFDELQVRVGQPANQSYVTGGKQPAGSYDLRKIDRESLILEPFALWVENKKLKFFAPPDPAHVSHSIVNCQNDYAQDAPHIEVSTTTPEALLSKYDLKAVPLMKLDIEGAEIDVIRHMVENAIHVRQLLVEFDEMNFPSERSKKNVEDTDRMLKRAGYLCRYCDGKSSFLYALR